LIFRTRSIGVQLARTQISRNSWKEKYGTAKVGNSDSASSPSNPLERRIVVAGASAMGGGEDPAKFRGKPIIGKALVLKYTGGACGICNSDEEDPRGLPFVRRARRAIAAARGERASCVNNAANATKRSTNERSCGG